MDLHTGDKSTSRPTLVPISILVMFWIFSGIAVPLLTIKMIESVEVLSSVHTGPMAVLWSSALSAMTFIGIVFDVFCLAIFVSASYGIIDHLKSRKRT